MNLWGQEVLALDQVARDKFGMDRFAEETDKIHLAAAVENMAEGEIAPAAWPRAVCAKHRRARAVCRVGLDRAQRDLQLLVHWQRKLLE